MPFGLQGASVVLMRVMNSAVSKNLHSSGPSPEPAGPLRVPGVEGPIHRSVVVYMDDVHCLRPTLEQQLPDVREILSIFRQGKLYVKASKCTFEMYHGARLPR